MGGESIFKMTTMVFLDPLTYLPEGRDLGGPGGPGGSKYHPSAGKGGEAHAQLLYIFPMVFCNFAIFKEGVRGGEVDRGGSGGANFPLCWEGVRGRDSTA